MTASSPSKAKPPTAPARGKAGAAASQTRGAAGAKKATGKTTTSTKAAVKPSAKPAVKKTASSPAKSVKAPAKSKAVAASKAPAKPGTQKPVAAKSVPGKTAAKTKAKTATPAKTVPKTTARAKTSAVSKSPTAKVPVKKVVAKAAAPVLASAKTGKTQKLTPLAPARPPTPVSSAPVVSVSSATEGSPRMSKANARLAQITVPSIDPAAAHASRASYVSTLTQPVLDSPLIAPVKKDPKLANNWKTKSAEELSDEELIAMPDSEYMNDKQLAAFRQRLQKLKQDILTNAGETTEHLREDTVVVPDPADRATIEEEHALELRTRDRERKLLKKIEQSIARIDASDYGYCDETGEPIGVGRLLARPTATLSLEAQQRRELKQKMFGD
ncbi:RNA polymerase-binding protein DksA [Hylemonella gracilis]|uniref:RNA polymerase-binding transcription factor DksA n=1 Tax=Hylemonella gracilis TaxID=80880 RepID=A0A4P6UQH8_9BURK|nr:RNA polymerase-binding protein DksA [Hylemonella gracilis]